MKNLLITTAFVIGSAGAVAAQDSSDQIRALVEQELATYDMEVDIDSLTDEQISELHLVATSEDGSDKEEGFRAVLNDAGVMTETGSADAAATAGATDSTIVVVDGTDMERSQLAASVEQSLATYNIDVDVGSLTDEQLSEIYLLETSSDNGASENEVSNQQRIEEIVGM